MLAKRTRRHENHRWLFLRYKLVFCLYLAAWAVFELAKSLVVSLWICGGGLVWGSFQILVPRQRLPAQAFAAESSWNFGQILPIMFLGVPIFSFARGYTIQKAEKDRKHDLYATPPSPTSMEDQSSNGNIDEGPSATQTLIRRSANAAITSNTISISTRGTCNGLDMAEENIGRGPGRLPPWRDNSQIYASHFIIFAFWGSQVGVLALATFIVFYRGLFLPLGIFVRQETRQTLLKNSWIWLIVGCAIGTYVLVGIALLVGGSIFSSLFVVDNDELDEVEEL
ncbi:MAG: hypothetical protein L6R36_009258 [Xanthoria steineri]|nr:MAG: hypothetical protein L6R36_009258 [Xanthoria steineri]